MRIGFLGTPEFANESLRTCINFSEVVVVVTQPDRKRGRGKKLQFTHVKEEALKHDLNVFQPKNIKTKESVEYLKSLDLDLMVVVAYGQILSKEVLEIPKYGCINVHASLLPKLRGAAPINWAIVRGYKETGVTTMQMDIGLDTGDMLDKTTVKITENMTAGELHDILMAKGAKVLEKTLNDIKNNDLNPVKQNDEESTYAPMMNKKLSIIDWNKSAQEIHDLIRGFNPWPVAHTKYSGKKMKVYESEIINDDYNKKNGEIVQVSDSGILVQTKEKCLNLKCVQFPNKRRMNIKSLLNGNDIEIGVILGG